jgi:putative ABC transport system substrate-binding protein
MTAVLTRRELATGLAGVALTWPLAALAQTARPTVGFLGSTSLEGFSPYLAKLRQGLSETGFTEGRNVAIELRWADNDNDRLQALAVELVRARVNVIVAPSLPAALAARAATADIPIVFYTGVNPVELGLVQSFNRPGGNLTGVVGLGTELGAKRVELLHELVPMARSIALLVNATTAAIAEPTIKDVRAGARTLGIELHILLASTEQEIDAAFSKLIELRASGLVIGADNLFNSRSQQLAALALRHAIPAVYQYREFAVAGGLMAYGGSLTDAYHLIGTYAGRILKGEKPAELPIQQSTTVELIVNLKTAAALGLTVPLLLRGRADEVVE